MHCAWSEAPHGQYSPTSPPVAGDGHKTHFEQWGVGEHCGQKGDVFDFG